MESEASAAAMHLAVQPGTVVILHAGWWDAAREWLEKGSHVAQGSLNVYSWGMALNS